MTMTPTFSIDQLAESNERLARRLGGGPPLATPDILTLVRAELVRHGYKECDISGTVLADVTPEEWVQHGLIMQDGIVRAEPWLPAWLDHYGHPPDGPPAQRSRRQPAWDISADRFAIATSGHQRYRTVGLQAAVRTAMTAQPGESLLCVLPTGSGKTDVVIVRARSHRPSQTLVVVPTVSLAIDLERRVQALTDERTPIAYHGDLAPEDKDGFRRRLVGGEQWLTVTSPEAACTVLVGRRDSLTG